MLILICVIDHRVVELPKTEEGLGFNVMGGKEQNSPIYISRIIPGPNDEYDDDHHHISRTRIYDVHGQ